MSHDFKTQPPAIGAPSLGQIPPVTPQKPTEEEKQKKTTEEGTNDDTRDQDN